MDNKTAPLILITVIVSCIAVATFALSGHKTETPTDQGVTAAAVASPFAYSFDSSGVLNEAGSDAESTSPYWWLNSGGELVLENGTGSTVSGDLPPDNKWRVLYAKNNPQDTDNGLHPQNLFRLVTRSEWENVREQAYFKVTADELSASPNRSESNGLLFFNRYRDSQNLYYAGVRVDGTAVIKKKANGVYTTLAQAQIFPGTYNRDTSPNLLPKNTWIGLRTETVTMPNGGVMITLSTDVGKTGVWKQVLQTTDDGTHYGPAFTGKAYAGIRTDFMDVTFDEYSLTSI